MAETPWNEPQAKVNEEPQLPAKRSPGRPKKEQQALAPIGAIRGPEVVIAALEEWERVLLHKPGQEADQEFAQVRAVFMRIAEQVARLLAIARQTKCARCKKPLPARGPWDTIPKPAPETMIGWINQHACSARCAEILRNEMHDREMKRLAEANA